MTDEHSERPRDFPFIFLLSLDRLKQEITLDGRRAGEKLLLYARQHPSGKKAMLRLLNTKGNAVATFLVKAHDNGLVEVEEANVTIPYQRCGIGLQVYSLLERDVEARGGRLEPTETLNPDSLRLWLRLRPDDPDLTPRLQARLDAWQKSGYLKKWDDDHAKERALLEDIEDEE